MKLRGSMCSTELMSRKQKMLLIQAIREIDSNKYKKRISNLKESIHKVRVRFEK
jgi:hypothetical protein